MMIILLLSAAVAISVHAQRELLVQTDLGPIQGHYNAAGAREWGGIPYALPPVGELRWEYPQSPQPWTDVYAADITPPGCAQYCDLPEGTGTCPDEYSEDCLYLNVYSPAKTAPVDGYPVLFWIHGGAFESGTGICALYNGTGLTEDDTVVVSINYRLGAMGFMASQSMKGNYGFMDMILALRWTQRNIRAFGGDPNSVTIFGQSAGGMSVGALLFAPAAEGLFKQGIMESNPLGLPFHSKESAATNANNMNNYLNCPIDDVDCMKSKTMEEILDAQHHSQTLNFDTLFENFLPWAPLVEEDGEIPEQPLYALAGGRFKSLPLMSGSTRDEGQLFVYALFTEPLSETAYKAVIRATFGEEYYKEVIDMYPFDIVEGSTDGREAANVLATDLLFYCPLRNVTRGYQAIFGGSGLSVAWNSYIYRFEHVLSFDCWEPDTTYCIGYVCHASELPFIFKVFTDGKDIDYDTTTGEKKLTRAVWLCSNTFDYVDFFRRLCR